MALVLKTLYKSYFWLMDDVSDPRALDLPLMSSPFPEIIMLTLWFKFIFNWGPTWMKDRPPYDLKYIMIVYNAVQVVVNLRIVYICWTLRELADFVCMPVDYSNSKAGLLFLHTTYLYHLLKIADLLDTVFFVLRKKYSHVSFLHTYHHFGMVVITWIGAKFIGGGHVFHLGWINGVVHVILYAYYLLTAYDSEYGKLVWLKRLITQLQLVQFGYIIITFTTLLFMGDCGFPKIITLLFIPQNFFMFVLFGDFYIKTYILPSRRKTKELSDEKKTD